MVQPSWHTSQINDLYSNLDSYQLRSFFFGTICFHLNFPLLMFLLWDSKRCQFRNNFYLFCTFCSCTILYIIYQILWKKCMYEWFGRGPNEEENVVCSIFQMHFLDIFIIAAPIFYISILKLYHRWYDIVSIILPGLGLSITVT